MKILSTDGKTYTYEHSEDGKTAIGTWEDVSDIVELTKDRRAHGADSHAFGYHEASIPITTLDAWAKKISGGRMNAFDVANDDALLDRFMSEHGSFKVRNGWQ